MDPKAVLERLKGWLTASARPAGGLLLPVSGGSDSALAFWLLNAVFPEKTVGVHAGTAEGLRCGAWFEKTGKMQYLPNPTPAEDAEIMRWACFQVKARREGRWLVGARNRTEHELGAFSLASRAATLLPLSGVWKSDVIKLCHHIGVPEEVTASSRRADPDCGRPPEMSEVPLEEMDLFLRVKTSKLDAGALDAIPEKRLAYLERLFKGNRFRRDLPACGPQLAIEQ